MGLFFVIYFMPESIISGNTMSLKYCLVIPQYGILPVCVNFENPFHAAPPPNNPDNVPKLGAIQEVLYCLSNFLPILYPIELVANPIPSVTTVGNKPYENNDPAVGNNERAPV